MSPEEIQYLIDGLSNLKEAHMNPYPMCRQYGLEVSHDHIDYIPWKSLDLLPDSVKVYVLDGLIRQTTHINGAYPWDVEKILWRLQ